LTAWPGPRFEIEGHAKILIIDDDAPSRGPRGGVTDFGHDALTACQVSGFEAGPGRRHRGIFLDLRMPGRWPRSPPELKTTRDIGTSRWSSDGLRRQRNTIEA